MSLKKRKIIHSKKAVSIMIGYVLLVSLALIMGATIYTWLKTYVPKEAIQCPEGVSLYIKDYKCDADQLNLTLKNNGRFEIAGYFVQANNNSELRGPTMTLADEKYFNKEKQSGVFLVQNAIVVDSSGDKNLFQPTDESSVIFDITGINIETVYITPVRFEIYDERKRFASCGESRIKEILQCN